MAMKKKRRLAEQLCVLFHEAVRHAVAEARSIRRAAGSTSKELHEVDKSARAAFMRAAAICIEHEVDPREYIVAQFSGYREASAYHRKFLLPQPHHIGSTAAEIRWIQYKVRSDERVARRASFEAEEGKHFSVDERRLRGLARMQRRSEEDVLAEQPEQFSRAFLKHKRVWEVVKDVWDERRGN